MGIIHWNDLIIILIIAAAILVPELLVGFETWKTITRLGIMVAFCVLAMFASYYLQVKVDPATAFIRAFSIGLSARILLTLNHMMQGLKEAIANWQKQA